MIASTFTPAFLGRVVDVLLPGLPAIDGSPALPAATEIGVDVRLTDHLESHSSERLAAVLEAIAHQAGGQTSFVGMAEVAAIEVVQRVEADETEGFLDLLFVVSADYYESEDVIRPFGWRVTPPQPLGYSLPQFDEESLASVKARNSFWRSATPER